MRRHGESRGRRPDLTPRPRPLEKIAPGPGSPDAGIMRGSFPQRQETAKNRANPGVSLPGTQLTEHLALRRALPPGLPAGSLPVAHGSDDFTGQVLR